MPPKSSNKFTKKSIPRVKDHGWDGQNMTSNEFGFESPDGQPFGIDEFGGIRHFKSND